MKLFASKPKGKHVKAKGKTNGADKSAAGKGKNPGKRKLNLGVRIAIGTVLGITALALGALAYLKLAAAPPDFDIMPNPPPVIIDIETGEKVEVIQPTLPNSGNGGSVVQDRDKFPFLLMGMDDGNGNTDVIMSATLDINKERGYSLNVVNIPRDTLVNVSWYTKKANSIYSVMKKEGTDEDPYKGVREAYSKILGYEPMFIVVVDLKAFSALVDAVDGIYFDVPRTMDYDDPVQNLSIHISKGPQTLNGKQALGLVRWRQNNNKGGYATGDIGRIELTQKFLLAAAAQIIEKKDSINIVSLANIFLNYVETDLKLSHVVWFAQELFKLNAEDITFDLLPGNINDEINGDSYVTIYPNEWVELINAKLNPFNVPITLDNLSILTRGSNNKLYVTNGVYAGKESWGSSSGGSSGGSTTTPKPSSTPTPTATPTPTSGGAPTDTPTDNPVITDVPVESPVVTETPLPTPDPFPTDAIPTPTPDTMTPPPATPPDNG